MKRLIFCDLEFTCGHHPVEIIQLGAVKISEENEGNETFKSFIKPNIKPFINEFCHELTGITQGDIDNARLFPEVYGDFLNWIGDVGNSQLVFWGNNDAKELSKELFRYGISLFELQTFDFQKYIKREIHTQLGLHRALELFDVQAEGTQHDALDDAINLRNLYLKIMESPEKRSILNLQFGLIELVNQLERIILRYQSQSYLTLSINLVESFFKQCKSILEKNNQYTIEERGQILESVRNQSRAVGNTLQEEILAQFEEDPLTHSFKSINARTFAKRYKPFVKKGQGEYSLNLSKAREIFSKIMEKYQEPYKKQMEKVK